MCPLSNRVLHGGLHLRDITRSYARLVSNNRLHWVRARADGIEGLGTAAQQAAVPHAWKAGPQTEQLRNMLRALPDQGVVAISIPKVPFRCPPGPYERASLIAYYLSTRKPRAKLLVFDANPEIQAKKGLFESVWASRYSKLIEYVPNAELKAVDSVAGTLEFDLQGKVSAQVMNVIPPQRAGQIARASGLANVDQRWCGVDFLSYESTAAKGVYVLGDSISSAGRPKSGHMANQQGKVCAGAIAALTLGQAVPSDPIIANTCYSFISHNEVVHVAAVYRYNREQRVMAVVPGSSGVSTQPGRSGLRHVLGDQHPQRHAGLKRARLRLSE